MKKLLIILFLLPFTLSAQVLMPENFSDGKPIGVGMVHTLSSAKYTVELATSKWPRTAAKHAIALTMTLDWLCWQEASYTAKETGQSYITSPGGKNYYFSNTLVLPDLIAPPSGRSSVLMLIIELNGSGIRNYSGKDIALLDRYPLDMETANQWANQQLVIRDGQLRGRGSKSENDIGIRIGGSTRPILDNLKFDNFGIGVDFQFCLEGSFTNLNFFSYGVYAMKLWNGQWLDAANSNAQSNIVYMSNLRFYNGAGHTPISALYMSGNHTIRGDLFTFEGDKGSQSHIFYEGTASGVNVMEMSNIYVELAGCTRAMIRIKASKGQFIFNQIRSSPGVIDMPILIEAENPANTSIHIFLNRSAVLSMKSKLRSIGNPLYGVKWYVEYVSMNDNATFNSPLNFDNTFPGSYLPAAKDFTFTKPL